MNKTEMEFIERLNSRKDGGVRIIAFTKKCGQNDKCNCACSEDEPYCGGTPETCRNEVSGLYFGEGREVDVKTKEDIENKNKEVYNKFKNEINRIRKDNNINTKYTARVRHCEMLKKDILIEFERQDLPCVDEITSYNIYYDPNLGKQFLRLGIRPLGNDTYIGKFVVETKLGRIYMLNKTPRIPKAYERTLLSEDAINVGVVGLVDKSSYVGKDEPILEYHVQIEL